MIEASHSATRRRRKSKGGRAQEGCPKSRATTGSTTLPLNVVNVHCSVFKAHPGASSQVLRQEPGGETIRAWRGMGDPRVASSILYEGRRRLALRHRSGAMHNA